MTRLYWLLGVSMSRPNVIFARVEGVTSRGAVEVLVVREQVVTQSH